jgi:SAM-dependent methyltransferase
MQFAWGYAPTLIIEAAVENRLFDLLDPSPRTLEELIAETGTSTRGLSAILNALVGLKLLTRLENRYGLTPESAAYLVSTKPGYRGLFFQHHTQQLLPQWQRLGEVVRTGKPAARTNRQSEGGEYFAKFVESLFPVSFPAAQALGAHLNLAKDGDPVGVLDIGAGSGVWGIALALLSPRVRIRAVDWEAVLEVTKKVAARHGVADRLTVVPGDFFEADFGGGHQVAVLGHILHSEGPERILRLLRKIFEALAPGGTLAIQEFMPNDDRSAPPHALIFAVNMLVNTESGGTYTFPEMRAWLLEAGFTDPRVLDVPGPSPLVLADKPRL